MFREDENARGVYYAVHAGFRTQYRIIITISLKLKEKMSMNSLKDCGCNYEYEIFCVVECVDILLARMVSAVVA